MMLDSIEVLRESDKECPDHDWVYIAGNYEKGTYTFIFKCGLCGKEERMVVKRC